MTQRRARREYSEAQKKQLVEIYNNGKPRREIIREYDLTGTAFDRWENVLTRQAPAMKKTTGRLKSRN